MANNLSIILWILIVNAVVYCVPDGISYRELQAVNFYDRTYPRHVEQNVDADGRPITTGVVFKIEGRMRRFFHAFFFSGFMTAMLNAALFVGWVPFWYYQQPTEWYDIIMALTTLYLGLVRLLPKMFIMTDDNYETRTWIRIENFTGGKVPKEAKDESKVLAAKQVMVAYSALVVLVILCAAILLCINKGDISDWTIYVSVVFYFCSLVFALAIFGLFVDILYTQRREMRSVRPRNKTQS